MDVPTSFYDLPNNFLHLSYMSPLDDFVKTDFKGSLGPERTDEPALLMRDEVPRSQVPTPITRTSSISSTISSPSSLDSASTNSSDLTSHDSDESLPLQWDGHLAPAAMRTAQRRARRPGPLRRRGPNKRRAGTGYADMMDKLPIDVQDALRVEYPGCCERVKGKDISTMQKHQFSNRHFNKVPDEFQHLLPSFTCPAFVSLHGKCKSAKAGRYDSTERHCKNCAGFHELFPELTVAPIEITKGEFKAVQDYRKTMKSGQTDDAPPLVEAAVAKVLMMLIESAGGDLQYLASLPNLAL
ncbi:hypothetical protein BJV78DRAFT_1208446 [Lactifluus subvellereus]|nr:hypothetical protein BJV78DRAFT_1208446 [Lactifluus subvellereus]